MLLEFRDTEEDRKANKHVSDCFCVSITEESMVPVGEDSSGFVSLREVKFNVVLRVDVWETLQGEAELLGPVGYHIALGQ